MGSGLICDNCGTVLSLDGAGGREDAAGESAGWIEVSLRGSSSWDACTRSCAVQLLADDGPIRPAADAWAETVTEIARTVRESREADDG